MEQETLFQLLDDPSRIQECSTVSLEQLVHHYPWVPTFQLLLTKKYQLGGHEGFDAQLQKAALLAVDRQRLFTLINEPPQGIAKEPEEHNQPSFERVEGHQADEEQNYHTKEPDSQDQQKEETDQKESADGPAIPMEEAEAYHQFMKEFGIIRESSEKEPETKDEQQNQQDDDSTGVANQKEKEHTSFASDDRANEQIAEEEKTTRGFTEWLAMFKQQPTRSESEDKQESEQSHPQKENEGAMNNAHEKDETIPEEEMEEVSEQAEKSVEQSDKAVSQTLAQIYESQKKYVQAISIYEKLRLKYPEKSSYFVDKINELKKNL